jgi:hypothetical protein
LSREFDRVFPTQRGDAFQHVDEKRRFVALALATRTRLIGRVGFQQQAFDRQRCDRTPQSLRALVGHRSADADGKFHPRQFAGLLEAAGEAVHDPTQRFAEGAQRLDHLCERAARVQHQRQVEAVRQLEMTPQEVQLPFEIGLGAIETAFAHGRGRVAVEPVREPGEVGVRVLRQETRVQSVGRMQPGIRSAQVVLLGPPVRCHRRHLQFPDACSARTLQDFRAIGIELRRIEMCMAVEQRGQPFGHHGATTEWNMNRERDIDVAFIVGLFESNRHKAVAGRP